MGFLCSNRCASRTRSNVTFERLQTAFGGLVTATLHVGNMTPLAPVCATLQSMRQTLEKVQGCKERLTELHHHCELMTTYVILQDGIDGSQLDITPLKNRVDELNDLVQTYAQKTRCRAYLHFFLWGDDIDSLKRGIDTIVCVMDLAASARAAIADEDWTKRFAHLEAIVGEFQASSERAHVTTALAPVPKNAPRAKGWHIVRTAAMRLVHTCLSDQEEQGVVGIVGRSGSGKTTLAAAVVGARGGCFQSCNDSDNEEVLAEIDRVRQIFPDGVVWLRVGRGANAPDRLRELMQDLAKRLYNDVMERVIEAPQLGEDGTSYIRKAVTSGNGGKGLCCLVVADDVWEAEVVDQLRETGMRVLITTRERSLVDEGLRVSVERLTDREANDLLRATVGLSRGADLPEEATNILDRCDNVAMYVEFVGRWSILQTGDDGVPQDTSAWQEVVRAIDETLNEQDGERKDKRLAILHAGFKYLRSRDVLAQELYMALAVLPDGHPFTVSEAAVLLFDDGKARHSVSCAKRVIVILEQWAVITPDGTDVYHMHDAHTAFGKESLIAHEVVREDAVRRWTAMISAPAFLCAADTFTVVSMWRALERVKGVSWRVCRKYHAELDAMNVSNELFRKTAESLAVLHYAEGDYLGAEMLMQGILGRCYDDAKADPTVVMSALWFCMEGARLKGDAKTTELLRRQLEPLLEKRRQESSFGLANSDDAEKCLLLHMFGLFCFQMENKEEAESLHRQALEAQQRCNLGECHPLVAHTMYSLGVCLRDNGRLPEAEMYLRRSVDSFQARLASDDLQVAYSIRKLACVVRESERPSEAVKLFKQSLEIFKTRLDPNNLQVAVTLHELGRSFLEAGLLPEAKTSLQEALSIKDTLTVAPDGGKLSNLEHDLESCGSRVG